MPFGDSAREDSGADGIGPPSSGATVSRTQAAKRAVGVGSGSSSGGSSTSDSTVSCAFGSGSGSAAAAIGGGAAASRAERRPRSPRRRRSSRATSARSIRSCASSSATSASCRSRVASASAAASANDCRRSDRSTCQRSRSAATASSAAACAASRSCTSRSTSIVRSSARVASASRSWASSPSSRWTSTVCASSLATAPPSGCPVELLAQGEDLALAAGELGPQTLDLRAQRADLAAQHVVGRVLRRAPPAPPLAVRQRQVDQQVAADLERGAGDLAGIARPAEARAPRLPVRARLPRRAAPRSACAARPRSRP